MKSLRGNRSNSDANPASPFPEKWESPCREM
jgi:hypothetical protein